jgi:hypothetical protein
MTPPPEPSSAEPAPTADGAPPHLSPGAGLPLVPGAPASILESPPHPARYLYSRRNLLGCGLAFVGIVVAFTGLLGPFWPIAVVGLYTLGVLVAPRLGHATPRPQPPADARDIRHALTQLVQSTAGRLPADVAATLSRIESLILSMLPRVAHLPASSEDVYILRATVVDYLPTTLASYLDLPRDYATQHRLTDGETAEKDVLEQLALLESKMSDIAEDIARSDSDRLLANGRFLREKFGRSELRAPAPEDERNI